MIYVIDFETFSNVDIKRAGSYLYATNWSTMPLCMSYATVDGDDEPRTWKPGDPYPKELESATGLEAHNSEFERLIWKHVMVPQYNFPPVSDDMWTCTAARAAAFSLPRKLEKVAAVLKLPIQKDMEGHGVMLRLCRPRKASAQNSERRFTPEKYPEKFERLYSYCEDDVRTERCLSHALPQLTPREYTFWRLDQRINDRGVCCDIPTVKMFIKKVQDISKEKNTRLHEITGGHVERATQVARLKQWLYSQGCLIPSLARDIVEQFLDLEGDSPEVQEALQIRLHLSRSSTKKLNSMLDRAGPDSRIRNTLLFHGASTGRWAGMGIQPHNFTRGLGEKQEGVIAAVQSESFDFLFDDDPLTFISGCLRGMLRAGPRAELFCADYSAIEHRVLCWLANCEYGLDLLRAGKDPYIAMASNVYATDSVDEDMRHLGKTAVLGLGFQMAAAKFLATCEAQGIDVSGWTELDDDGKIILGAFPIGVVDTFRELYHKIVDYWWATERAAKRAISDGGAHVAGYATFGYNKKYDTLLCKLPIGRFLAYQRPRILSRKAPWGKMVPTLTYERQNSQTFQWERTDTYGGKLVENITQAVARDVMAEAMLRVDGDYPIVMTVHDEIVSEVPEGKRNLDTFCNLMATNPDWAKGLPIKVEGWKGQRYRK